MKQADIEKTYEQFNFRGIQDVLIRVLVDKSI